MTSFSCIGWALKFFLTAVANASRLLLALARLGAFRPIPVDSTVLLNPPDAEGTWSLYAWRYLCSVSRSMPRQPICCANR